MISSIGGSNAAQSLLAQIESRKAQATQQAAGATPATPQEQAAAVSGGQAADGGTATIRSAQSEAIDRLGGQLNAQADATRAREASGEPPPPPPDGATPAAEAASSETDASASEATSASAGTAAAGGARAGASAGSSGSQSESTDYIAEADTNNDRKVSEQERIAYEKKQAQQAEKTAQDVRQAYTPAAASEAGLDVSA